ncbi:MAG TPA: ABC transporter ATP-binding protein [Chthoniobacteraceae bacterium]|jgi:iron complex transport system ATP-binding protein|nr:ABC transporter ATP-binding protein [Chthoniobacteraceae bacterium]
MSQILSVADLGIVRDGTQIIDHITWSVRKGEHWVILGANGSGKTSLLSALTGYLTPTTGDVEVLGLRYGAADWRELRRAIGIVSSSVRQMMHDDEPALDSVISGKFAMIDFWGKSTARDRAEAMRILRQVECPHLAGRPWRVLSQGERQRVLIGRAMMAHPRLLILDEPAAGLDPVSREHFLQFIQRLGGRRNSPALILVTHHVEEIVPIFSHVLLLKGGRVLAAGSREAMLATRRLSETFGAKVSLRRAGGRYQLAIHTSSRAVC